MSDPDTNEFPTLIRPIVDGVNVGWKAKGHLRDGTEADLSQLAYMELTNPKYGTLAYGKNPGGNFDSWAFHENGGGGAVIVPYATVDGNLLIGVVEQDRPNQGGKVLNVPRGFLKPGEPHWVGAERELAEEVGKFVGSLRLLPGKPTNPNSAFFETVQVDEGVKFSTVEVSPGLLVTKNGLVKFRKSAVTVDKENRAAEQITGCHFIPALEAIMLGDMFTVAGVGRLWGMLKS
ncbi:MAG: NUDIX domain-containing protein [Patescibacteria group bacterium]|jgi:hypothetical protein